MTVLNPFQPASDELIASRSLQNRIDTKFVFHRSLLDGILSVLGSDYAVVMSGDKARARYKNLYFDTQDFSSLRAHHRGKRPRRKVRIRHYLDRGQSFLEVKEKRNTNRTHKQRLPVPFMQEDLDATAFDFIESHSGASPLELVPGIRVDFTRTTLVALRTNERVTFDTAMQVARGDAVESLGTGVIAEVKQERFRPRSVMMLALRDAGALQMSLSKYCTAAQLLVPAVKLNRYRPKLRMLRRRFHV